MGILKKITGKEKAKPKTQKGKIIVIDGIDGSGKSTQFKLLAETLTVEGYKVQSIKFPRHGEAPAYFVDKYLNRGYGNELSAQAISVFYAVDRFDASDQIKQWLDEGYIVLMDRYVSSNAGHQGSMIADAGERIKFFKWLDNLEYTIFNIPKPDLTIVLNMPAEIAVGLLGKKGAALDIRESDMDHLRLAAQSYQDIAKLFPNTKLVDCTVRGQLIAPKNIHNKVWELVRRIALKDIQL